MSSLEGIPEQPCLSPWSLAPESRVWVGGHNLDARRVVERHLKDAIRPTLGPLDVAFITPNSADEAAYFASKLLERLAEGACIWVVRDVGRAHADDTVTALGELGLSRPRIVQIDSQLQGEAFERRADR